MPDFAKQYRTLFDVFGSPLSRSHGVDASVLTKTEQRLGMGIPDSLRNYYQVAGNERKFNRSLQRFMAPAKWFVDRNQLVFLEENQAVCCWGVSLKSKGAKDPLVWQGVKEDEKFVWHSEQAKCSTFISVILHYQAVSGGFKYCGSAAAPDDSYEKLKRDGWKYAGEVNQLWAFHRQNQVVCIMPGGALPFMPAMMLMAGGKTAADLSAISVSLGVALD